MEDALTVGEKIRKKIETRKFPGQDEEIRVTISCGIAQCPNEEKKDMVITPTDFIEMADQALYYSKKNGRNLVTPYSKDVEKSTKEKPVKK